jgi:alkyl sulfatase BDS1-like metallo-beta-lactamase superfamily hydrolase
MGGREAVSKAAKKAFDTNEHQWAAELLTHLIRVNNNDLEARKLKADSLRQLAYKTENTNWRNWYITSARELDGSLNKAAGAAVLSSLAAPDILKALPVVKFFEAMTVRLDPVKSAEANLTMAFRFTDTNQAYAVEVRRGIAQVHESLPKKVDATLVLTTPQLHRVMARQTTFAQMLQAGEIKAEGNVAMLARFNGFFDPPATEVPQLTIR